MRISQIAKKAGVSPMLVSRVMKGSPSVIKQDRDRVERAVGEMKVRATIASSTRHKISRVLFPSTILIRPGRPEIILNLSQARESSVPVE